MLRTKRSFQAVMILAAFVFVAASCQTDREMFAPCRPAADGNIWGADGRYVLACRNGSWEPVMTAAEYVAISQGRHVAIAPLPRRPIVEEFGATQQLVANGVRISWKYAIPSGGYATIHHRRVDSTDWTSSGRLRANSVVLDQLSVRTSYMVHVKIFTAGGLMVARSQISPVHYTKPDLPVLSIDTDGHRQVPDRETYIDASYELDPNGHAVDAASGRMVLRGRGNTTWAYPKKPYRLKLDDKTPLLGMSKSKHWVLLANAIDRSDVRNYAALEIARSTDLAWTPDSRFVEVVFNGAYVGLYQLTEQVRVDKNRVAVDKLAEDENSEPEITGGYLIELDTRREARGKTGFLTTHGVDIVVKRPKPPTTQQFDYVRDYVQSFEDALFSASFDDPGQGWRAYADEDSYIDQYWVREFTRDKDANLRSSYLHKPRNGPLMSGPVWDFDRALGNAQDPTSLSTSGWLARDQGTWTERIFQDAGFRANVDQRWPQLRDRFVAVANSVEAIGAELVEARRNNQARWPISDRFRSDDASAVARWIRDRAAWIDAQVTDSGVVGG